MLKRGIKDNRLAHFYLISQQGENSHDLIAPWLTGLISASLGFDKSEQLINHQDVLIIKNTDHNKKAPKNYHLQDFTPLFHFFSSESQELQRKFVFIYNAHKLTVQTANQLLKIFEEPQINASIFLLNWTNSGMLETIKSRAVGLVYNSPKVFSKEESFEILDEVKRLSFAQFSDKYKYDTESLGTLILKLTDFLIRKPGPAQNLWALDDIHKNYQQQKTYHSGHSSLVWPLYQIITQSVLN